MPSMSILIHRRMVDSDVETVLADLAAQGVPPDVIKLLRDEGYASWQRADGATHYVLSGRGQ